MDVSVKSYQGTSAKKMLQAYRLMQTSRMLDKKMLVMLRQGKSYFHIGCMGHEAIQAASAFSLIPKRDWLFPYYRDQTLVLGLGMTPKECMLGFLARASDPSSGGRQLPMHYGDASLNIPTSSSSTGTQFLQAVGCAHASMREWRKTAKKNAKPDYAVTLVCAGDGTTSQGDFHEALNWAAREKLPIIFLIENNGYAISVPLRDQRPGAKVATLGKGYEGLRVIEVDGCNFAESLEAMGQAVSHARLGHGPVLVDASVVRLLPHSSSDDHQKYRPAKELEADKKRDPIELMHQFLLKQHFATKEELHKLDAEVVALVEESADFAEGQAIAARETATTYVLSDKPEPKLVEPQIDPSSSEVVLVDAINRALAEEMARDEKVLVFGQDVAGGKGGVFTATRYLTDKFGADRCFNAPLAESSIVGVAIGLAMRGFKPVPEIQFGDYIWTAMMQIRNELTTIRYRSNNMFSAPVVIRTPVGGYIHGGLCHSQNIEAVFAHFPGIKVALPSTALDAYGLLKSAIMGDDPVLFLEHKALYRQNFAKSKLPTGDDWLLPFGKGAVRRAGRDLTVVTYGAMVQRAIEAARQVEADDIDVEVIDLRTIRPYDFEMVASSVAKTSRVLVLYEDNRFLGFGAEIAAEIAEKCFASLDAPVMRLAGADVPIPYSWELEEEVLPQTKNIVEAIQRLASY